MTRVVVDTDVVSFLFKSDTRAALYRRHLDGRQLLLSFMTLAELDRWALAASWGHRRRARLYAYLTRFTIYPYDRALCRQWAEISHQAQRSGRPIHPSDAWIAATAMLCQAPLVTHNPRDYRGVAELTVITDTND